MSTPDISLPPITVPIDSKPTLLMDKQSVLAAMADNAAVAVLEKTIPDAFVDSTVTNSR